MSQVKEDLIRKLVRELVRQELDEANSTASVGGSYNTPHAFGGSNKKGKGKGKAGYTGGHDDPTDGTGHFIADDPKLRKESVNEAKMSKEKIDTKEVAKKMKKSRWFGDGLAKDLLRKYPRSVSEYELQMDLPDWVSGRAISDLFESIKESVMNEGRYHAWRNDDSKTPKQKIGMAMRETRDNLTELERMVNYNVKLKNELKVDSRDYWKNTHKALSKISERLVRLANKVGQLH
jgi:hypothetical protein